MVIRHIRNGVEMPPIVRDDYYDFNYQDEVLLNQPVQILPGDDMVLECTYDSSQRNNATVGGWGTPQEMCMVFMEYYPKMDGMTDMSCMSFTDPRAMLMLLGIQNRTIGNDFQQAIDNGTVPSVTFRGRTMPVTDFYNTQVQWTPQLKASLQNFTKNSKQTVMCEMNAQAAYNEDNDNGQSTTNTDSAIYVNGGIKITQPYMPPNVCAMQRAG